MDQLDTEALVSVCCITYNQEKYIAQAMEGFVMQKTSFKYEIIIGEDCSTDRTREIVEDYARRHPLLVILITSPENVGPVHNVVRILKKARGKYIAFCDGDDYWTDPNKLQKQVDFLQNNSQYVMCAHYMRQIEFDGQISYLDPKPVRLEYSYNKLIVNKQQQTPTASMLVERKYVEELYSSDWYPMCHAGDKFVKLFATFRSGKKIYVIPEVMSCYRRHSGGIWSMTHSNVLKERQFSDFSIIIRKFKHNSLQKMILLRFYMKRYMSFEIKTYSLSSALQTIRTIL